MGRYLLPTAIWSWGAGTRPSNDCLPWQRVVSAKDYLTYLVRIEKVGFVADVPVPAEEKIEPSHPGQSVDQASYRVRYSLNKKPMEGMFHDVVICSAFTAGGIGASHTCFATVVRWFAPLGKLQAMIPTFSAMKMHVNPAWMSAWQSAMASRMNNLYAAQSKALLRQGELAAAARMQEHKAFMASQEAGAERRDIQFEEGQYQKQSNNDNFVDYVLDCQRYYNGNERISDIDCPERQTF